MSLHRPQSNAFDWLTLLEAASSTIHPSRLICNCLGVRDIFVARLLRSKKSQPLMTTSDAIAPILPDFTHSPYFSFGQGTVTWHHPRKTKPEPGLERLKLHFSLLFERRNMVKIPSIATGSLGHLFQSLLACVLYVITFRTTAWCCLFAEPAQRHVEAMLPELREAVLKMSHNEEFSVEFVQNSLYFLGGPQSRGRENEFDDSDEWDLDTPSLDERWKLFYNGKLHGWTHGADFIWAIHGLLVAIFFQLFSNCRDRKPPCLLF